MPSADAAEWLLSHHSRGEALVLIDHISLARSDNLRLARHFLAGQPHAHDTALKVFAKRLSVADLTTVMRESLREDLSPARLDLLLYYLEPVLTRAAKSAKARDAAQKLLNEIEALKRGTAGETSTLH
jgi:hypothetical protein